MAFGSSKFTFQSGDVLLGLSEGEISLIDPESKVIFLIVQQSVSFLELSIDLIDPLELIVKKCRLLMDFGKFLFQLSNNVDFMVDLSNKLFLISLGNGHDVDFVFKLVHSFLLFLNVFFGPNQSAVGLFVLLVAQFQLLFEGENFLSQSVHFLL